MAPQQKPHRSVQDVQTPPELLLAIRREFHVADWTIDLAANESNAVCDRYFGQGSRHGENSLQADWPDFGDCWCNPPYADIDPWAAKCAAYDGAGRIFLLVPASIGSNWYQEHIHGRALVVALSPRVTFVGHKHPYPKDLVVAVFSRLRGGFTTWRWRA